MPGWTNTGEWLVSIGLGTYAELFAQHEITGESVPHLKESHLIEMGIDNVGDRLKIISEARYFLRGKKTKQRNAVIMKFHNWKLTRFSYIYHVRTFSITESAIMIRDAYPLLCSADVDNVDISSIKDMSLEVGVLFGSVTIVTTDPSIRGGKIVMQLTANKTKLIHGTIKTLWEEDQIRMGVRGAKQGDD